MMYHLCSKYLYPANCFKLLKINPRIHNSQVNTCKLLRNCEDKSPVKLFQPTHLLQIVIYIFFVNVI